MRIAMDTRKSEKEQEYIRMRCKWLQDKYGYSPEDWALIFLLMEDNHPDKECVWALASSFLFKEEDV